MTHRKTGEKYKVVFDSEKLAARNVNDKDDCLWLGAYVLRKFPKAWELNIIADLQWVDVKLGESKGLFFIQSWLYGKAIKAFRADNRCECGTLILCECHDKCAECDKCKVGEIAEWGMGKLGALLLAKLPRDRYDDEIENEIRDAMESGDYRRSSYDEDDDDEDND